MRLRFNPSERLRRHLPEVWRARLHLALPVSAALGLLAAPCGAWLETIAPLTVSDGAIQVGSALGQLWGLVFVSIAVAYLLWLTTVRLHAFHFVSVGSTILVFALAVLVHVLLVPIPGRVMQSYLDSARARLDIDAASVDAYSQVLKLVRRDSDPKDVAEIFSRYSGLTATPGEFVLCTIETEKDVMRFRSVSEPPIVEDYTSSDEDVTALPNIFPRDSVMLLKAAGKEPHVWAYRPQAPRVPAPVRPPPRAVDDFKEYPAPRVSGGSFRPTVPPSSSRDEADENSAPPGPPVGRRDVVRPVPRPLPRSISANGNEATASAVQIPPTRPAPAAVRRVTPRPTNVAKTSLLVYSVIEVLREYEGRSYVLDRAMAVPYRSTMLAALAGAAAFLGIVCIPDHRAKSLQGRLGETLGAIFRRIPSIRLAPSRAFPDLWAIRLHDAIVALSTAIAVMALVRLSNWFVDEFVGNYTMNRAISQILFTVPCLIAPAWAISRQRLVCFTSDSMRHVFHLVCAITFVLIGVNLLIFTWDLLLLGRLVSVYSSPTRYIHYLLQTSLSFGTMCACVVLFGATVGRSALVVIGALLFVFLFLDIVVPFPEALAVFWIPFGILVVLTLAAPVLLPLGKTLPARRALESMYIIVGVTSIWSVFLGFGREADTWHVTTADAETAVAVTAGSMAVVIIFVGYFARRWLAGSVRPRIFNTVYFSVAVSLCAVIFYFSYRPVLWPLPLRRYSGLVPLATNVSFAFAVVAIWTCCVARCFRSMYRQFLEPLHER